jgi:hypothetical protein
MEGPPPAQFHKARAVGDPAKVCHVSDLPRGPRLLGSFKAPHPFATISLSLRPIQPCSIQNVAFSPDGQYLGASLANRAVFAFKSPIGNEKVAEKLVASHDDAVRML